MSKKLDTTGDVASSAQRAAAEAPEKWMAEIPDFTAEQWAWLQAQTRDFERDYVPTHSLLPGI